MSEGEERTEPVGGYFVLQVETGKETVTEELIRVLVPEELCDQCFHLSRKMRKKIRGEWKDIRERLFPGYVFIRSGDILALYEALRRVPRFTKVLGREDAVFTALSDQDVYWLGAMGADETAPEVGLSAISFEEGNRVVIVSGPLKNLEGNIKKINLHKRYAEVEMDFMGRTMDIHLGFEILSQKTE